MLYAFSGLSHILEYGGVYNTSDIEWAPPPDPIK